MISRRRTPGRFFNQARYRFLSDLAIFVFVLVSLLSLLSVGSLPSGMTLKQGQVSPRTFKADRTVEVINTAATEAARRQAANQIEPVYVFDPAANQLSEEKLVESFAIFQRLVELSQSKHPNGQALAAQKGRLPISISPHTLEVLSKCTPAQLKELRTNSRNLLWRVMEEGVRSDRMSEARRALRETADDMFRALSSDQSRVVVEIAGECLVPNKNPDFEATMGAQQAAKDQVRPITTMVPDGAVVVREGDPLTAEHIRILEALGANKANLNSTKVSGYTLLIFSLMGLTVAYLRRERPDIAASPKYLFLISLIFVGTAGVCRFLSSLSPYVVPIATSSILVTVLLEARLAMLITTFMAIFVGVLTQSLPATCVGMIAGFAGILALSKADHRSHLIASTVVVGLVSTSGALTFSLISSKPWQSMLSDLSFGALSGIISAAIAVGVMPTLEYIFGITTHFRLLDISNPGESLLQKLLKNAPGTYQHSIMVANLAESAAQAIGANALLCKVGAYYHDIGKMKRPRFFVENQMGGENPHDRLAPSLSTTIIHSHIKDGIEVARQNRLPELVVDFISEHHGTTLVKFFYHQARTRSSEPVYEDDFRYPGPKPQSREAAIVLLSDGIEAAARTMGSPTTEKLTELVGKMVQDHQEDGQLDECDLSLKDIRLIRESLIRSLQGIYHTRIEYPEPSSLRGAKKVTNLRKKA